MTIGSWAYYSSSSVGTWMVLDDGRDHYVTDLASADKMTMEEGLRFFRRYHDSRTVYVGFLPPAQPPKKKPSTPKARKPRRKISFQEE